MGRRWRQKDQRDQGSARYHGPGPQGSQGPGRSRSQGSEGRCLQGRGRQDQETARRRRCEGRAEVVKEAARVEKPPCRAYFGSPPPSGDSRTGGVGGFRHWFRIEGFPAALRTASLYVKDTHNVIFTYFN